MTMWIACIVEGHAETEALPLLIRRVVQKLDPQAEVEIPTPIRLPRSRLLKQGELERAMEFAARKTAGRGAVLILLDSDDECPAKLAPTLLARATKSRGSLPLSVVLCKREFESWFLAGAESLRGHRGLSAHLQPPADPENVRGAKEWLRRHMEPGRKYVEVLDQPALTARLDLELARRSDSFDKCYRDIRRLVTELRVRQT